MGCFEGMSRPRIVAMKPVGSSKPEYGIQIGDAEPVKIDIESARPGVTFPKGHEGDYSTEAAFLSARTFGGDRDFLRSQILDSGMAAVEATFPPEMSTTGLVTDLSMCGLSLLRLLTVNQFVCSRDVGIYGLMEIAMAQELGMPTHVGRMGDRKPIYWLMDNFEIVSGIFNDKRSVLELIMDKADRLREIGVDVDKVLATTKDDTLEMLARVTYGKIMRDYLDQTEPNPLDLSQRWVVARLQPLIRQTLNNVARLYQPDRDWRCEGARDNERIGPMVILEGEQVRVTGRNVLQGDYGQNLILCVFEENKWRFACPESKDSLRYSFIQASCDHTPLLL